MNIKILSINKRFDHNSIYNSDFKNAPSFSDFDVVIIDPIDLSRLWTIRHSQTTSGEYYTDMRRDGGFGKDMYTLFNRRKEEIEKLLKEAQGMVICYLRDLEPLLKVFTVQKKTLDLTFYSWLPSCSFSWNENRLKRKISFPDNVKFQDRNGKSIGFVERSHPFSKYFDGFKNQIKFECIIDHHTDMLKFLKVISRNKVNEIVSLEVPVEGGKIIFIPPNTSRDSNKELGVLLNCIEGIYEYGFETTPPDWVEKYSLPNENKNQDEIERLEKDIKDFENEKQKLIEEQENIKRFKRLLYEKGRNLETSVRGAFRLLGFNVIEPKEYDEDYDLYIKEKNFTMVGEIEGTDNSVIDIDKFRQLFDYVNIEIDKDAKCRGILIGNAFRLKDVKERSEQFSKKAIKRSDHQGYCRMTTSQLYDLIKKILSESDNSKLERLKKHIKGLIKKCNTEFKFESS